MTAVPTALRLLRIVNVTVPWLTVPAGLVTPAVSVSVSAAVLYVVETLAAAAVAEAAPTVRVWLVSVNPRKFVPPL